jgi:hypothetical protein
MSEPDLPSLIEGAGFIFRGRVVRDRPAGLQLQAGAAEKAVAVVVDEVIRSTPVMSGLVGKEVIVVNDRGAALGKGISHLFFTNCVVLGHQVIVQGAGYAEWSPDAARQVTALVRESGDRPLRQRVAAATLVITGTVARSEPAAPGAAPTSEHDPDWWVAHVQRHSVIKGASAEPEIEVLFANSIDIAWYKAPKLRAGTSAVLILEHLEANQSPPEVSRAIYQAIHPLDALPMERLAEVQRAADLAKKGG